MPTAQEILTDVKSVRYPGASIFTDAQLLNMGNEILRKVWKWMEEDGIYRFNIIANQSTYSLPTDGLAYEKISTIEIATDSTLDNYDQYSWRGLLNDTGGNYFYKVSSTTFGLSPEPTESITDGGVIFYGSKFTLMSASALTATPAVNEDYHSLITNYICMKAAESGNNPDTESRNNFAISFNDDWQRLMFDWTRKKCKTPIKDRKNPWWR
jgi:hypothetical protein